MKKLLSAICSLAMVFSLSIPTFAIERTNDMDSENINFNVNQIPNVGEGWAYFGQPNNGLLGQKEQAIANSAQLVSGSGWFFALRSSYGSYASHYTSNSSLEGSSMGYIINQNTCPNFEIGNYHMSDVGCEIAATYNALKQLGRRIPCSDIIRAFEKNGYLMQIKSCGDLGSDPYAIGDYLSSNSISFTKYTTYSAMSSQVDNSKGTRQVYIASFWNSDSIKGGLHTVAFYTTTDDSLIHIYNLYNNSTSVATKAGFSSFVASNKFIVGYNIARMYRLQDA